MRICVDTSILLDIVKDEFRAGQEKLYAALAGGETLVIPSVVYAELLPQFKGDIAVLNEFLKDHKVLAEALDVKTAALAAERWMNYLKRKTKAVCPHCGKGLDMKRHVLADFYIGAFALAGCDTILTRDRGVYKKYFPDLDHYRD